MTQVDKLRNLLEGAVAKSGQLATQKLGILGTTARDVQQAQRSITVGLPVDVVRRFWLDGESMAATLPSPDDTGATGEDTDTVGQTGAPRWRLVSDASGQPPDAASGDAPVAWRSIGDEPSPIELSARFVPAPADLGTEVTMTLRFVETTASGATPAGIIVSRTLRNAKSQLETGEIPTLRANPAARPAGSPGGGGQTKES